MMPPFLKPGDQVALVSTARRIAEEELAAAIELLHRWGLKAKLGNTIGASHFQFAGDDGLRCSDLQEQLDDPETRAIWFARGGYGTVRIIDHLDWRRFQKHPKWLCGFSDLTVIHAHLDAVYGIPTIHSFLAWNATTATQEAAESLRNVLFGRKLHYAPAAHALNRPGAASGLLCGGNLSVWCNLLGSASEPDTQDKILFLEDIDEHYYHLDRMMMTLKRAGKLDSLAGLVIGQFTDMKNKEEQNPFGQLAYEIISRSVEDLEYPVCFGFPAGHEPDNRALMMGVRWNLQVTDEVLLRMESA